jgi:teichuronic acid biosynthesis glycosyltransferase TuaC
MRVLVLSRVFPNPKQPSLGVFIRERMRRVAEACDVIVVAPVPWFPFNRVIRPDWSDIPLVERQGMLRVYHPRFFCFPRYLRWLDGVSYALCLIPFLRRLRREFVFDVIDAHFAYPDGLAAVLLGTLFRRPVVITLRGSIVRLARSAFHRRQLRFALSAADRVLSVSEALKEVAVTLGTPSEKVRVIPNGVDADLFTPKAQAEARRALDLPSGRPIILSVGALIEHKGHHRVIGRLPDVLRHHPDLLYVVVGGERRDGWRRTVDDLVARRGLQNHVLLAGDQPHDRIPVWLAAADVFCLASRSEGWPNSVLEALACGKPVVATRVGGVPEIVADDTLGLLVPPGDDDALATALVKALGATWDTDAMVAHARAHSWSAAARQVLTEFHHLVAAVRTPHADGAVIAPPRPEER